MSINPAYLAAKIGKEEYPYPGQTGGESCEPVFGQKENLGVTQIYRIQIIRDDGEYFRNL